MGLRVAIMVEVVKERTTTKDTLEQHPDFQSVVSDFPPACIQIHESPWMPLAPSTVQQYPAGVSINRSNVSACHGCRSVLATTTVQADGRIAACCGLGMRLIPELQLGHIADTNLDEADRKASDDFLKQWIRVEGPERILAWAATHDNTIKWENMYGHQCQACLRLYTDPAVRNVIRAHHKEKLVDVLFADWLLYEDGQDDTQRADAQLAAAKR